MTLSGVGHDIKLCARVKAASRVDPKISGGGESWSAPISVEWNDQSASLRVCCRQCDIVRIRCVPFL